MAKNIVLAALTRASTQVDQAKALECWKKTPVRPARAAS